MFCHARGVKSNQKTAHLGIPVMKEKFCLGCVQDMRQGFLWGSEVDRPPYVTQWPFGWPLIPTDVKNTATKVVWQKGGLGPNF